MASASLTTIAEILKTDYGPSIRELLNNKNTILGRLEKDFDSYDHKGKNFTEPIHTGRNEGIGSRAESGTLPTAGSQTHVSAVWPDKYSYGVIKITRQMMKASQSDKLAFAKGLQVEMKGLLSDLKNDQDRQMFNDGLGTLATCSGAGTDSTTINVDSTRNLRVGQAIDICVAADGTESYGQLNTTVASITSGTRFVVADAVGTYASLDTTFGVFPYGGHAADNSVGYEPYGLAAIVADTDTVTGGLAGLAVASYPVWKSVLTNHNGALTELAMQKMQDDIEQAGNGKPNVIYTSYGVNRAYQDMLTAQRSFTNTMTMDGGVKKLTFNGLPILVDKYCPAGVMWFVDESNLVHFVLEDWGWADEDGDMLKWVAGYDAYTAYMCKYSNIGCHARNAHGKLYGITEA
jgi:hypothetical protein